MHLTLSTTKKGNMSVVEYYTKMKDFGDDVAGIGRPLNEGDLVVYIIIGLNEEFESLVLVLIARVQLIGMEEL